MTQRRKSSAGGSGERVSGRQPVLEVLRSGRPLNKLFVAEGAEGGSIREILARARERGVVVVRVPRARLDEWTGGIHHQGVVADVAPYAYADVDDLLNRAARSNRPGLFLFLDGIEDPHNLGAILRTAEAAGVHGVVIPKRRAAQVTEAASRASAGAAAHVPVARVTNLARTVAQFQDAGYWVVGTDGRAPKPYFEADYTGPTVLVVGGEGAGMSRLVRERCDEVVHIPMLGRVSSLNAGAAAAVVLFEAVRQRSRAAR